MSKNIFKLTRMNNTILLLFPVVVYKNILIFRIRISVSLLDIYHIKI